MGRGRARSDSRGDNERSRSRGNDRSASRGRGSSEDRDARRKRSDDYGVDTLKITDDDAAFILGKGGKTKEKIAKVADADVELFERDLILEFRGSKQKRRRAQKYAEGVMAQRSGPVHVDEKDDDGDLTALSIPQEAVGFVTGRAGNFLRTIEEEWCVLMFFCEVEKGSRRSKEFEKLAIFGELRGRRGAELKVLSAVESKVQGFFNSIKDSMLDRDRGKDESATWGTDTMTFEDDELSYALGKQGGTRKKIERSSGAIVQYIGHVAVISGARAERKRAKEYIKWLFAQLEGPVYVDGWEDRDDCTVVDIPSDCIGYVTGSRRAALGGMEEEWGVLMFFMTKPGESKGRGKGFGEQLIICGPNRGRRGAELKVMSTVEHKNPGIFTKGVREKTSSEKGFDTDRMLFRDDEVSYALGKEGLTRKKLALASGCILQYIGQVAFMAGTLKERRRVREFIVWLLAQRKGSVTIASKYRDDVTEVHVPENCKGWVTGNRGSELRRMEQESSTYMFMALDNQGNERLLIFSVDPGGRTTAGGRMHGERLVNEMIQEKLRDERCRSRSDSRGGRSRSRCRSDSRLRSRTPARQRCPSRRRRSDSRR